MPPWLSPGGQQTADRHSGRSTGESNRGAAGENGRWRQIGHTNREQHVHESHAEERDVTEAEHAAPERSVAAHPGVVVEEETDDGAGNHPGAYRAPADEQVQHRDLTWRHSCRARNVEERSRHLYRAAADSLRASGDHDPR